MMTLGATTDGTTTCASPPTDDFCSLSTSDDHAVYYDFTLTGGGTGFENVDLTVDIAAGTGVTGNSAADIVIEIYQDGCGDQLAPISTMGTPCAALGEMITYECVPPGTYTLAIGSPATTAGDFQVTINEAFSAPFNDVCQNADDLVSLNDNCTAVTLSGTTINACPDNVTGLSCNYNDLSVVWHSITLPGDAVGVEISNITGGAAITVFTDNACPLPGGFFLETDCVTASPDAAVINGMTGGNTYLIGVSTDNTAEADYTFDVLAIVPPANDLCASAEDISGTASGGVSGTTACATAPDFTYCSFDATSHVVYYTYQVAANNNTSLEILISDVGGIPTTDISVALFEDCAGNLLNVTEINAADGCNTLNTPLQYQCVEGQSTITIAVGSPEGSEGDFTITITESEESPDNDECVDAIAIDLTGFDCQLFTQNGTNEFACPEDFTFEGCFNTLPTVWYSVTLPTDAVGLEISDLTPGFNAAYLIDPCGGLTFDAAGCFTDAGNTQTTYTAGDVIHIAISSADADEGGFSFNILSVVPPANDLCADSEDISGTAAGGVVGTTACATPPDNNFCGLLDVAGSHVVYYTYVVPATNTKNTSLAINITGSGTVPASDISVELYDDCATNDLFEGVEVQGDDPCSALDTELNYDCVAPGTSITFAIGSPEGSEGEFTITITEDDTAVPENDLCAGADEITFTNDCVFETVTTDNTGACPEVAPFDILSSCDLDQDAVIWFEATLPVNGVGFEFADISGDEYVAIFSGDCTSPVLEDDCLTANGQVLDLVGGDTYLIAVSLDNGAQGAIEFMIKTITPPANDMCADALPLTDSTPLEGTTSCATADENVCTLDDESHVVYFTYEVQSNTNTDITIETAASTGSSGTAAGTLVTDIWINCGTPGTDFDIDPEEGVNAECDNLVDQVLTYLCVPPGTMLTIAVGSTNDNDGDFSITITENADGIDTPLNDLCDSPTFLDVEDPCEWFPFDVSSVNACPEAADLANNCGFDDNPITWYSFDTPAGAANVEINIISSSAGNPIYSIFENDCNDPSNALPTALVDCESGFGEISDAVDVMPNTTYLLGIGSTDAAGSDLEIEIKINVPPANDDPCDAELLTANTTTMGTNLCATEDILDPNCADVQGESSVWYTYTVEPGVTGVEISFPSITAAGPVDVLVGEFEAGCTDDLTLNFPAAFTCDAATLVDPITINCIDEGTVLHILVSTEEDNAGDFEILLETIDPDPLCIDNDECDMVAGNADADQGVITTDEDCTVISDCNANACAEFIGDCGVEINNVVWYSVTNDGLGEFISASIENAGFDEPVIAIFDGGCGAALNQIGNCEFGSGGVANAGPFMIPADGAQYWIAVGSVGPVGGDFDLCIEINSGCVNDEPCDGVELMNGVLVDNPASTISCTQDTNNPFCEADGVNGVFSSVWYTFTVPEGFSGFEVEISNVTMTGNVGIQVGEYSDANCNNLPESFAGQCEIGDQKLIVPCAPEGTEYYIQIASAEDMNEGDFEIVINALTPTVENDLCSGIGPDHTFDITEEDYCMYVPLDVNTENACPEIIADASGCDFTVAPAVWFEITVPNEDGIESMDVLLDDITGFAGNVQVAIVQVDCDDIFAGTSIDCDSDGTEVDLQDVAVTADDPSFDLANQECSGATDDDAVWYTFTPSGFGDGFFVFLTPSGGTDGIMGNVGVEVYSTTDPNAGCTGNFDEVVASSCGSAAGGVELAISLCDPDLIYYIKVASAEDDCGDYNISISEKASDCAADECRR